MPPAGWYPDPADPRAMRWWSGEGWTEHVAAAGVAPAATTPVVTTPAVTTLAAQSAWHDDAPELTRFARDPALRPAEPEPAVAPRRDPYRDRNVLAGFALVVALLSIPGTIADALWELPTIVSFAIGGAPISIALLGLVASIKLGFPTRRAWLAIGISVLTMAAGWVIQAQSFTLEIPTPSVTDVPGITEIQDLERDSGVGG